MSTLRNTIDKFLSSARVSIGNGRQVPEILAALTVFGYDDVRLQEGRALLDTATALHAAQKQEYGEQYAATTALKQAWDEADKVYSVHRKLARLVLKDLPEQQQSLNVNGRKKQSFSGWLEQALVFYTNVLQNTTVQTALARFNITVEALTQGQTLVQAVVNLNNVQKKEMYEAQQATKSRDEAMDALDAWLFEYYEVAKIALADNPQQLEALQIMVVP